MSTSSSSNDSDSDISSFAAWEAQNPAHPSISEREQSLLDMKDPQRLWKDRDSSNDARSSGSEDEDVNQVVGLKRNGGVAPRGNGRTEIPSSTQATESQGLSQFVVCYSENVR